MHKETGLLSLNTNEFRCLTPSSLTYDMQRLIGIMKREPKWEKGELNTMILLKSPLKKILLTILHEGTDVLSYQSGKSLTIQIIEGQLKLQINNESVILNSNEVFTLTENVNYSFEATDDTAFLLTHLS